MKILLAAMILMPLVWGVVLHQPPLFRWGYSTPIIKQKGTW